MPTMAAVESRFELPDELSVFEFDDDEVVGLDAAAPPVA